MFFSSGSARRILLEDVNPCFENPETPSLEDVNTCFENPCFEDPCFGELHDDFEGEEADAFKLLKVYHPANFINLSYDAMISMITFAGHDKTTCPSAP